MINWIEARKIILRLDALSSADEVLEALEQLKRVDHWFDRKRAVLLIASRLRTDAHLVERLFVGVDTDEHN